MKWLNDVVGFVRLWWGLFCCSSPLGEMGKNGFFWCGAKLFVGLGLGFFVFWMVVVVWVVLGINCGAVFVSCWWGLSWGDSFGSLFWVAFLGRFVFSEIAVGGRELGLGWFADVGAWYGVGSWAVDGVV